MIKKCEWRNCNNFFTVGRKRKFCGAKCNLAAGRDYWKERNPNFKKSAAYRENENHLDLTFHDFCVLYL